MDHFKRIALYGHRGWASSAIANSLIAAGGPVSVLHRATSDTSALPAGTPTCEIDLKNRKSIQDALKDIDILISLVGHQNVNHQLALISALPHIDVRLFVPSDLAHKMTQEQMLIPNLRAKAEVEQAARDAGISTTVVRPGSLVESTFSTPLVGVDIQGNRIVHTGGSAHQSLNLCSRQYVAAAYAAIFARTPIAQLNGRAIGLREFICTGSEIPAALQRRHGVPPKVYHHSLEQAKQEIEIRMRNGDLCALAFSYRYPRGAGKQVELVGDHVWELQGYKKKTLEEVTVKGRMEPYKEFPPVLAAALETTFF